MKKVHVFIVLIVVVLLAGALTDKVVRETVTARDDAIGPLPLPTMTPARDYDPPCTAPGKFCILIR